MEKLFQNLGNAFFYTIIGIALLTLIFGGIVLGGKKGLLPIMGQTVEEQAARQEVSDTSLAEVKILQERKRPEVVAQETFAGNSYSVEEVFSATDADGQRADVAVLNAFYEGENVTASVFDGSRLKFEQSGTYRLKVQVMDQMGVSNICQVYVTCNE